ncbi:MAG: hypothetical protein ACE5MG_12510 [Candidatus Methylomirabilales bacterium]
MRFLTRLAFLLALLWATTLSVAEAGVNVWTSTGPEGGVIQVLALDPGTPTTLYAGTQGGAVFKSTDGGASWSASNTGLTNTSVFAPRHRPPEHPLRGHDWGGRV